jgi:hypothetical protein
MVEIKESPPQSVRGLEDAFRRNDLIMVGIILSSIPSGATIQTQGMILRVDNPTEEERIYLRKSQKERREYGILKVGEIVRIFSGKSDEIDQFKVGEALSELKDSLGERVFSHTHWRTEECVPIPSHPDLGPLGILVSYWQCKCRVVSWVSEGKTFELLGEIK